MTQTEMLEAQIRNLKKDAWEIDYLPNRGDYYKQIIQLQKQLTKLKVEAKREGKMKLFNQRGREVVPGEFVRDFRGKLHEITSLQEPRSDRSTGRVFTKERPDGLYPGVFGLEWKEDDGSPRIMKEF